jgi:hypothetical protein
MPLSLPIILKILSLKGCHIIAQVAERGLSGLHVFIFTQASLRSTWAVYRSLSGLKILKKWVMIRTKARGQENRKFCCLNPS